MQTGKATIKRVKGGLLHFAEVDLRIDRSSDASSIAFACSGRGFTSQGYLEDVPASGYEDWKNGATIGVTFALATAGLRSAAVVIDRIVGQSTDTNPTIVAVAAAHALWRAVGFTPPEDIAHSLETKMLGSFGQAPDQLPEL